MDNKHDSFAERVEDRLDEIFGETEPVPEVVEENTDLGYYPLRFLKATVLSIDWEITDEVMARFIEQVDRLRETHKDDNVLVPMLQMLNSTGKHVRVYRENSHPDSLKILKSIYVAIEKIITTKDISESDKKKILSKEIKKFQALKAQIAAGHLGKVRRGKITSKLGTSTSQDSTVEGSNFSNAALKMDDSVSKEYLISAFQEIKQLIRDEFKKLKEEMDVLNSG